MTAPTFTVPRAVALMRKPEQLVYNAVQVLGGEADNMRQIIQQSKLCWVTAHEAVARLVEAGYLKAEKVPTRHGAQWKVSVVS